MSGFQSLPRGRDWGMTGNGYAVSLSDENFLKWIIALSAQFYIL